eukprot:1488559-Amphidinium_carterae.1
MDHKPHNPAERKRSTCGLKSMASWLSDGVSETLRNTSWSGLRLLGAMWRLVELVNHTALMAIFLSVAGHALPQISKDHPRGLSKR